MKKVSIITLGCRVNQYESDGLAEKLAEMGFEIVSPGEKAEYTIVPRGSQHPTSY